jgi:hypothetical protein
MKRTVALALLGLAVGSTAYGQSSIGGINIGNYTDPYNPVVWDASLNGGRAVNSSDGVQLTLWYGEGTTLTDSMPLAWKLDSEALGYTGYYALTLVTLPDWAPGEAYSFQVVASGDSISGPVAGQSVVWQEQANIGNIAPDPITGIPGLPGISTESIGLTVVVPEPSTFALAGLGAAALLIFRRRS